MSSSIKKNSRPFSVCTNCRRRKVKCDKKSPCTRCIKSNLSSSCNYIVNWNEVTFPDNQKLPENYTPIRVETFGSENGKDLYNMNFNYENFTNMIASANIVNTPSPIYGGMSTNSESTNSSTIASSNTSTKTHSRFDSDLFNYPTMDFKKPLFMKDGNVIQYRSPISLDAIFSNNKLFVKFKSMMTFMAKIKEKDGYLQKQHKIACEELKIFNNIYTKEEIDQTIIRFVLPNINAILERLNYFTKDLQHAMLFPLLPHEHISKFINKHFSPDPLVQGEYIYNAPYLNSDYANFAMIFSVVKLVSLFAEFEEIYSFEHKLPYTSEFINELTLKFISFTDYKRKPTFDVLLAVLVHRINYFISDSISENSNAQTFYEIALKIAYSLGIHIKCDHIEGHTEESVRGVWNVLQFLDSICALHTGQVLKIDYRYCVPRLFEYWEPIILFFRNVVSSFNSTAPMTLNDIINLADSSSKLLSIFKTFDELLNDKAYGPHQYLFSIIIKSDFVICLQLMLFILRLSMDEIDQLPIVIKEEDYQLIEDYKSKVECQLFYSLVLTFDLMRKIANGKISHCAQSVKLMVTLRLIFSQFMIIGNKLIFCYLLVFNKNSDKSLIAQNLYQNDDNDFFDKKVKFSEIPLSEAEKYLCNELDNVSVHDKEFKNITRLIKDLPSINQFLLEFYASMSDKSPLVFTGKFTVHFKFLLFVSILLKNVHEYENISKKQNSNFQLKIEDWKQIIDKTTSYFIGEEDLGYGSFDYQLKFLSSDWNFLEDDEFRENIGYQENGTSGFDEIYQMFF